MNIFVNKNGQQLGPFSPEQINEYLAQGSLHPQDPAWHDGLAEWTQLTSISGITSEVVQPPSFDPQAWQQQAQATLTSSEVTEEMESSLLSPVIDRSSSTKPKWIFPVVIVGLLVVIGLGAFLIWPKAEIERLRLSEGDIKRIAYESYTRVMTINYSKEYEKQKNKLELENITLSIHGTGKEDLNAPLKALFENTMRLMKAEAEKDIRYQEASPDVKKRIIEKMAERLRI